MIATMTRTVRVSRMKNRAALDYTHPQPAKQGGSQDANATRDPDPEQPF